MIRVDEVNINGKRYKKTYSDTHCIERDGVEYSEAIDPVDSDRTYTESKNRLPELTAEDALDIIVNGGAV